MNVKLIALPVLVSGCIVNRACFRGDTDGFGYETALPVLVSRYIVNQACFGGNSDRIDASPVKQLCQCLCWGM